jgi:hypothetical protein
VSPKQTVHEDYSLKKFFGLDLAGQAVAAAAKARMEAAMEAFMLMFELIEVGKVDTFEGVLLEMFG